MSHPRAEHRARRGKARGERTGRARLAGAARSLLAAGAILVGGCATSPPPSGPTLVGTEWRLIHFQSSDDTIGRVEPQPDEVYTLLLNPDGSAAMQLFCNRGTGRWTSPDPDTSQGDVRIEPLAVTSAACPPSPLERLGRDLPNVRSFVIADRQLHLNLMMDGGDYVWVPAR